jgi:hypothetical protein
MIAKYGAGSSSFGKKEEKEFLMLPSMRSERYVSALSTIPDRGSYSWNCSAIRRTQSTRESSRVSPYGVPAVVRADANE